MGKKLARFQIVTHLSFIHSYSIDYLKDINLLNLLRAKSVTSVCNLMQITRQLDANCVVT